MIFVKSCTLADFLRFKKLPEKTRDLRHFKFVAFLLTEFEYIADLHLYILGLITQKIPKQAQ